MLIDKIFESFLKAPETTLEAIAGLKSEAGKSTGGGKKGSHAAPKAESHDHGHGSGH